MLDTTLSDIPVRSATGLIMLNSVPGVGRVAVRKVINAFDTMGELLSAGDDELKACLNVKQRAAILDPKTIDTAYKRAAKQINRAAEIGASVFSIHDDGYPERLKDLEEPPMVLYVGGDRGALDRSVSFVGTREPTDFGGKVAYGMASAFASDGFSVVSGLARGIDEVCHNAAIDVGGTTCAVLAAGLDVYGSGAAMRLAQRICENGGCIVSEYGFGEDANMGSYIARDRIIACLSLATVFVQGERQSGSMHSVINAYKLGRPIYVPNIPPKFQSEEINHTAINLSRMTAAQFSSQADWKGSVMDIVNAAPSQPLANAIMNRDDYRRVFDEVSALQPASPQRQISYSDIAATF